MFEFVDPSEGFKKNSKYLNEYLHTVLDRKLEDFVIKGYLVDSAKEVVIDYLRGDLSLEEMNKELKDRCYDLTITISHPKTTFSYLADKYTRLSHMYTDDCLKIKIVFVVFDQ